VSDAQATSLGITVPADIPGGAALEQAVAARDGAAAVAALDLMRATGHGDVADGLRDGLTAVGLERLAGRIG